MNTNDITWFFDRIDLLQSAGCMKNIDEVTKSSSFNKDKMAKMLDSNLPISERWFRPHIHSNTHDHGHSHEHTHGEHSHSHEHKHGEEHNHGQEHGHGHHHEKPHSDDTIVGSSAVVRAIVAQFGKEKLTIEDVPYFYQFLVFFG